MRFGIVVAAVAVICGLAVVGPVSLAGSPAQGAPPPPTPPVPPASSRASATLPVLPIDAQRAVEDYRRQQADVLQRAEAMIGPAREALMRQLEAMAVQMAEAGRGDDAVAVRAHIRLLQQPGRCLRQRA
jgi:hypothetical protein